MYMHTLHKHSLYLTKVIGYSNCNIAIDLAANTSVIALSYWLERLKLLTEVPVYKHIACMATDQIVVRILSPRL